MRPFNLEEYLAHPERKIVTRDGKDVRIICTDRKLYAVDCPIIALVKDDEDNERIESFTIDGKWWEDELESKLDLFFPLHEGWINIYVNNWLDGTVYPSKEEALNMRDGMTECIATIKIEWEE